MTQLMLAKIVVGLFLGGWFLTSVYLYFRGTWDTRGDVVQSIGLGFVATLGVGMFLLVVLSAVAFLFV